MSSTTQKKKASVIAKLMLQRNQAYSKLVEVTFPRAIRLSIHPHNNQGPKFGINLIHPSLLFSNVEERLEDERHFHIPTPWHNALLRTSDGAWTMLKAEEIRSLRPSDRNELRFQPSEPSRGLGGFFYFVAPNQ
ncbi:hypothetical protein EX895_004125 [Sporisorium graminicola]|uniref:Uncharacterized protein n=1 Tax=Sporisorium graminicola TaxID=280036 RepID=A0A4U7KTR0_9BASI|nr:hypothetical protein EX895_004125 [Sporisorium graminicola]TKY87447.1 hypothetical protein EX895_004125 [Sporisorium graminicola]